jgi:hypothetical protein
VVITQREIADRDLIKKAQDIGKALFAQVGPAAEDGLYNFIKERLVAWNKDLLAYLPLAKTGKYPGLPAIEDCLSSLRKFVDEPESLRFLKRFVETRDELLDLCDDFNDLQGFYTTQKHIWERLRETVEELSLNRLQLEAHADAGRSLATMEEILNMARPYGRLHEVDELIQTTRTANEKLIAEARQPAVEGIKKLIAGVDEELDKVNADAGRRQTATKELCRHLEVATSSRSIAHIVQAKQEAESAFDRALTALEKTYVAASVPAQTADEINVPVAAASSTSAGGEAVRVKKSTAAPSVPVSISPSVRMKKHRVIDPKNLWSRNFIETADDVETFLTALRTELEAALKADERVRIK